jgi:MATE family multidrug resistance protein
MKLNREILRLAVPSILANITVPLVGMADIAVAGHLPAASGAALIGGLTIGTMLFELLYWNFGFLRTGTGGLTAQAYGRGDNTGGILRRALRIALVSGAGLIALQWAVVWLAFLVVDCSPEVQALATRYFHICIWAAPAVLSLFAFKGWFIGMQDSVRPMTADLLVNGVNIALSVGLGFGTPLGFAGVAWATVISHWTGFLYCCLALRRRYRSQLSDAKPAPAKDFFALNRDLFLRSLGMVAIYIGFTVLSARFGDLMLAVSAILMKLLMLFSYFIDGFAYAGEALSGRFIGARDASGLRSAVRNVFLWSGGVVMLFLLVYGVAGVPLLRLMTSDAAVVQAGRAFLPWLLLMPLFGCPAFTWDGIFTGATAGRDLRDSVLLSVICFFGLWWACTTFMGDGLTPVFAIHLLMAAYFLHLVVRSAWLSARARKVIFSDTSTR